MLGDEILSLGSLIPIIEIFVLLKVSSKYLTSVLRELLPFHEVMLRSHRPYIVFRALSSALWEKQETLK